MRRNSVVARCALYASLTVSISAGLLQIVTPSAIQAQATSGNLAGFVKDSSGAAVPNVKLTVRNEATGVSTSTTSNGQGEYRAENLLPGIYDITATATGFSIANVKGVTIALNATATRDITLNVGSSNTVVEVSGAAGVVLDTTSENLTQTFETQELSSLPTTAFGQGVINTTLLIPGVSSTGGTGIGVGPSVAGQRQRDNNFMIEGIDNNNKSVTGPLVYVPNDAVGEFTAITTQFSPEFGHSAGAQFNTNIISGTNHFHGKLYEYFRNRDLDAAGGTAGAKQPIGRYDNNRYGGQLGGPIFRNKLFFFGNFERNTIGQNATYALCVPDAAGRAVIQSKQSAAGYSSTNVAQFLQYVPQANAGNAAEICGATSLSLYSGPEDPATNNQTGNPEGVVTLGSYNVSAPNFTNQDVLVTGMDYTISQNDNLRGRYIYNTVGSTDTAAALPEFWAQNPTKYHLFALSEFHNFTPNLVNEARIGFNRFEQLIVIGTQKFPGLDSFPNLYFFDMGNGGTFLGPDPNAPQFTIQNLYQLTDNVSYTKGRHTLKLGFDGRKYISPQGFTQRARGDYEWSYLSDYLHDYATGPNDFAERSSGNHTYYGDQMALYGYANDTFRASSNMTLNMGLRYEFTSVPTGERAQALNAIASVPGLITFGAPQPARTSFAPRFGVEWAPSQKTSVRAGFGMAYDVLFDNLGVLAFPPEYSVTQDVGQGSAPDYSSPNFLKNGGLPPGTGSGTTTFPTAAAARAATSAYVPNQVVPYTENYSLTIQHQFASGLTAEIGYVGDHGVHLPTQNQINKQPKTTPANYLPTYVNGTAINGQGTNATNLAAINANSAVVPGFLAAGFTNPITSFQPFSGSNYNGLMLNLQGRLHNGLQLNGSYTWSKAMDNATAEVFSTTLAPRRPQNPQNMNAEYSRSVLDHTQRLTFEANYDFQLSKTDGWLVRNVVGNWVISPIYTYESPEWATVLNGSNALLTGDGAYVGRPIVNPHGVKGTVSAVTSVTDAKGNVIGYTAVNPNAYYIQAGNGAMPDASRQTLQGRPIDNLDLSAYKRFTVGDHYTLEIGAQALNALNHAQYVSGSVDDAGSYSYTGLSYTTILTGGQPSSVFGHPELVFSNNPRVMQLSAKLMF